MAGVEEEEVAGEVWKMAGTREVVVVEEEEAARAEEVAEGRPALEEGWSRVTSVSRKVLLVGRKTLSVLMGEELEGFEGREGDGHALSVLAGTVKSSSSVIGSHGRRKDQKKNTKCTWQFPFPFGALQLRPNQLEALA